MKGIAPSMIRRGVVSISRLTIGQVPRGRNYEGVCACEWHCNQETLSEQRWNSALKPLYSELLHLQGQFFSALPDRQAYCKRGNQALRGLLVSTLWVRDHTIIPVAIHMSLLLDNFDLFKPAGEQSWVMVELRVLIRVVSSLIESLLLA